jgi:hypothetical protein
MSEQTITDFYSQAVARDFSRDFLFRIININFGGGSSNLSEQDLIYATAASIPSRTINNIEVPYRGLTFNVPGSVKYGSSADYKIKFYCDANADLYTNFIRESRRVFQDADGTGDANRPPTAEGINGTTGDYRIAGQGAFIRFAQIDKALRPIKNFDLIGVSIREVGPIEYKIADGKGDVVSFDVSIAYHYYVDSTVPIEGPADSSLPLAPLPSDGSIPVGVGRTGLVA